MMLHTEFPRDLAMIAAIFGLATVLWAGWAQEKPPSTAWRVALGAASVLGLALVGLSVPRVIRSWDGDTAIEPGTGPFVAYIVVFWVEVVAAVVGSLLLVRRRRGELMAPLILLIVGIHFVPLTFVFGQGILLVAAVLLVAAAVAAYLLRARATPSFWCGILAAPVFLVLGLSSLLAAA